MEDMFLFPGVEVCAIKCGWGKNTLSLVSEVQEGWGLFFGPDPMQKLV